MTRSRWHAALGAMLCWCGLALGQLFGGGPSKNAPTMDLRPAFDPVGSSRNAPRVPCDRWLPFILELGPGDAGGIIMVSFRQDATQRTTIMVPFAATPGRAVRLPLYLSLPAFVDEIRLSMEGRTSDDKRVTNELTLGGFGADDSSRFVPVMTGMESALVLWCGTTSLEETTFIDPRRSGGSAKTTFGSLDPELLATTPMGYDACSGLVIRPGELRGVPEQAKRAVREWVESGGRLVLVCEDAGSDWMSWVPDGIAQACVELGEPATADLTDLREAATLRDRSLPVRSVRVLGEGEASGWRPHWRAGAVDLAATGPAGLGMVTILGADPTSLLDPSNESAREAGLDSLWQGALTEGMGDLSGVDSQSELSQLGGMQRRFMSISTGASDVERQHLAMTLDSLAQAPALGRGLFWGIGIAMLALVLLLGPGDYFILKRLGLSHRSWMTALGWIGLASAAAMIVPGAMRSGDSQLTSTRQTDLLIDGPATRGWSTGFVGIFSGSPINPRLTQAPEGGWWRGVSRMGDSGQRAALKPLSLLQVPGSCVPLPGEKSSPMPMGLWMFRTLMEQSRGDQGLRVGVRRALDEWDVTIEGLPPDVDLVTLHVRWAEHCTTGLNAPAEGGKASLTIPARARIPALNGGILESPAPGSGMRTEAMRRRVQTGHWVLVELSYRTTAGPYALSESMATRHQETVRALVRLPSEGGASR